MFEDNITIFNKKYDSSKRDYNYIRTYLSGVNVEKKKAVNVIKSGLENASSATIYIPIEDLESEDKEYISPKNYQKLSDEETEKYFTLQPGDYIVVGEIDYLIDGKENTTTKLKGEFDDVFGILIVDDKLKGGLPHWEVTLK